MSYYIFVSVEISCIMASIRVENQYDDFVKVMQDSTACFHLLRFYIFILYDNRSLDRAAKHFCSSPEFPLHVLSLELAALAINLVGHVIKSHKKALWDLIT